MDDVDPICPLCRRPIPPGVRQSIHHLVPKLKGGAHGPTALLHQICHDEIHAALTEAELARDYDTPEALRTHPRLARFIAWIETKPPEFDARSLESVRRRRNSGRRRR
ncbi:MAG: HNH endonuclease [Pseudomonadota bacterium]